MTWGCFSLDTAAAPEVCIAERYSWRWAIEPSNATGKQPTGAGDASYRTAKAVERTVPFTFLVQSLMILWYAISCDPAAGILSDGAARTRGTGPRPPPRPPTCTPPSAASSPPPE